MKNIEESRRRVIDTTIELATNSLLVHRPDLFYEWIFEKNDELGFDIYKISYGSEKVVWWKCPTCKSEYDMTPNKRTSNRGCPYCGGYRVNHTNSLASKRSDLIKEWHPVRNNQITPDDLYFQSTKKVWWVCSKNHEWEASLEKRVVRNQNCPTCSNVRVIKESNSMSITNPNLASQLLNHEDGFKYTQGSNKKVDWKCRNCDEVIKGKRISDVKNGGLSCPKCSPNFSFGERFVYSILSSLKIEFQKEVQFEWSNRKRYDFYLKEYNMIIEVHGMQHYGTGFNSLKGNTLKEEQENDRIKESAARANGIENYIIIDARHSDIEFIKKSLVESRLLKILNCNEIELQDVEYVEANFMHLKTWELWNSGMRSASEIADTLKTTRNSITSYLKRGAELGRCDYDAKVSSEESLNRRIIKSSIKVVKLTLDGEYLETYDSITEATRKNNMKSSASISSCCSGYDNRKKAGGFKWMYKEDYDKLLDKVQ